MTNAFVSAKSGDNVSAAFVRITAELAGVGLTKPVLEVATKVVRAQIIEHPEDRDAAGLAAERALTSRASEARSRRRGAGCVLM
jgi:hypothetical protein